MYRGVFRLKLMDGLQFVEYSTKSWPAGDRFQRHLCKLGGSGIHNSSPSGIYQPRTGLICCSGLQRRGLTGYPRAVDTSDWVQPSDIVPFLMIREHASSPQTLDTAEAFTIPIGRVAVYIGFEIRQLVPLSVEMAVGTLEPTC